MKKIAVLFLAVSAVMMSSCSKDDGSKDNSSETSGSLEGTWVGTRIVTKTTENGKTTTVDDRTLDLEKCDGFKVTLTKTQATSLSKYIDPSDDSCKEEKSISSYVYENGKIIYTDDEGKKKSADVTKLTDSELVLFEKGSRTYNNITTSWETTIYLKKVK